METRKLVLELSRMPYGEVRLLFRILNDLNEVMVENCDWECADEIMGYYQDVENYLSIRYFDQEKESAFDFLDRLWYSRMK